MNEEQTKLVVLISTVVFTFLVYISGFKNNKPTCNNYIVNVYLYLALSLSLMGMLIYHIPWEQSPIHPFIIIGLSFLFIILLSLQNEFQTSLTNVALAHLYWFLFLVTISAFTWVYFKLPIFKDYVNNAIWIVALIFIIMSAIVYIFPNFFKSTYGIAMGSMLLILLAIIIFELTMIFSTKKYGATQSYRYVSYLVIVLFSVFISYDTSRVFELSEKCVNYPNYPQTSISFFLDILNLFVRIVSLSR